jgi:hypothetical protein
LRDDKGDCEQEKGCRENQLAHKCSEVSDHIRAVLSTASSVPAATGKVAAQAAETAGYEIGLDHVH